MTDILTQIIGYRVILKMFKIKRITRKKNFIKLIRMYSDI